ncbi:MAG: hypothetical protein AAGA56_01130 [Myxococcota bacterium]
MKRLHIVLHAHLPWVKHHRPWSVEERWFHDARWTAYVPLLEIAERHRGLTFSLSPSLLAMLEDEELERRSQQHCQELDTLNRGPGSIFPAAEQFGMRLSRARESGPLIPRLCALRRQDRIATWTTAASHAYLPGFSPHPRAIGAQLILGDALFRSLMGGPPQGVWIPECGVDDVVVKAVEAHCSGPTVVAEHALGEAAGVGPASSGNTVWLPRQRAATHRIWSRDHGFPGHANYREFHLDLAHRLAEERLGPFQRGTMSGLKYWRIGDGPLHPPYEPTLATAQVERDAADMTAWLDEHVREDTVTTLAFDAELFGHWWWEGPQFLERLLARIDAHPSLTLSFPHDPLPPISPGRPVSSSWGRGGDHRGWVSPRNARQWRDLHMTFRTVWDAGRSSPNSDMTALAWEAALQMSAGDWLFLLEEGTAGDYPLRRLRTHRDTARRSAELLSSGRRVEEISRPDGGLLWRGTSPRLDLHRVYERLDRPGED